ncbi:mitochondrial ribosomal protein VAR1, putative [Pediculus humanus corporis]|uniref:Mitochondrial ribosomal protein VAR1, putative n=1 Tax=Pediculus humanus subsp. corporis TaxID=121224 RepID=E0VUJ2_PEDHC|nr:mitochondrial ribosomal protein VAR1, putative [Pediculus humanus corporis]EEB17048.1 mitochondrial ribosomal protein VAR1, putative [Pediculus humanus corporis]
MDVIILFKVRGSRRITLLQRHLFVIYFKNFKRVNLVYGLKFDANTFFDNSLLIQNGRIHYESLTDKTNIPQFGSCWKNAINDLQLGCKHLSEEIQNDLALKFTDCFLQMSGYEPLNCKEPINICPQKLSDRAFNAYTEFYTHTHSICFFLQSQTWQEEAEKTVNKLSLTSLLVSKQLKEADKNQQKLLKNQNDSLLQQQNLFDKIKIMSNELTFSQGKIISIIDGLQNVTFEQNKLLFDLMKDLLSLKLWTVSEVSWFNSIIFYVVVVVINFIFTSVDRTHISNLTIDLMYEWFWVLRRICVVLSLVVLLYSSIIYCDFKAMNHKLLLQIKHQNEKIIKLSNKDININPLHKSHWINESEYKNNKLNDRLDFSNELNNQTFQNFYKTEYFQDCMTINKNDNLKKFLSKNICNLFDLKNLDQTDHEKVKKQNNNSTLLKKCDPCDESYSSHDLNKSKYNLRSCKKKVVQ